MNDLISRKAVVESIRASINTGYESMGFSDFIDYIEDFPTAYDVDEVVEQLDDYLFDKYCIEGDSIILKIVEGAVKNE